MKPETPVPSEVSPPPPARRDTILIVDDSVANTEILLAALADTYDVSVIQDGPTALAALATVDPDLILLDVMMPGMDGYEVCAQLQANPDTCDIPVIFLTAMAEDKDEEKGLNLGAVDYITKPFKLALVKARVRNHLALRHARIEVVRQRDQVEVALQKLRKLEQQRDDLVHMIVHDLRSPLTGLMCYLDLLAPGEADATDFEKSLCAAQKTTRELCAMVSALLDVSRLETGQFASIQSVNLIGPKGRVERVRVLGPARKESQVEISRTEQFKLGIEAPLRDSGDLEGTPGITLESDTGILKLSKGVICAKRHIHMSPAEALALGLRDKDVVMVKVKGMRELIFGDVLVRVHPDYLMDMHLDTDEANAAQISEGTVGYIEAIQHRNYM
jgi:propanediol utilization protein/CheY-like chemotaxis protein